MPGNPGPNASLSLRPSVYTTNRLVNKVWAQKLHVFLKKKQLINFLPRQKGKQQFENPPSNSGN